MSTMNSLDESPRSTHSRSGFWAAFSSQDRRRLLEDDLQAGKTVSFILASIVVLGTVMMIVTVLLAI